MKKLAKLLIFSLVLSVLSSSFLNVFAATAKVATYKNLKFGYQLQYESTWKLNGSDANSYSCYLRPVTYKGSYYPQIIVSCQTLYDELSVDDATSQLIDSYKSQVTSFKLLSSKKVKTAMSDDSREVIYTFKQNGKYDGKERVTIVNKDGILYQIILAALTKEYQKYEPAYNNLLKTIKVNSGATNTLNLPCIYTALSSDKVQEVLSDKTLEDTDVVSVATSYGTDRDITFDAEYAVSDLIRAVIAGKYDETKVQDKYSGVSPNIPSNQALLDLSKKYAALSKSQLTFYSHGSRVIKAVKNADGVTVGAIVHLIYDITDKSYNRIEGGTMDIYVEFDEDGNAGVYGLVKGL